VRALSFPYFHEGWCSAVITADFALGGYIASVSIAYVWWAGWLILTPSRGAERHGAGPFMRLSSSLASHGYHFPLSAPANGLGSPAF